MMEKLLIKFPENIGDMVMENLKEQNYIDDKKFILDYSRNKLQLKPMGPYKLKQELYKKKFNMGLIKDTLNTVFQEFDEYKLAIQLFEKRFHNNKFSKDQKTVNKIKNYFLSNGFNMNIVIKILKKFTIK